VDQCGAISMPPRVIEEDDRGRAGQAELLRGYLSLSRFHDGVSAILQRPAQGFAEALITIQQKHLRHRCAACLPRGGWRAAGAGVLEGGGLCYQSTPLLRAAIISPSPRMRGGVRVRWNWHLVLTSSPSQRDISETGSGISGALYHMVAPARVSVRAQPSKDYELLCTTSAALIYAAMIRLMVCRLARPL
jgi:hypothetical protein